MTMTPLLADDVILSPGQVVEELGDIEPDVQRENLNIKVLCRDCQDDPPNFIEEHSSGDLVCGTCGLVAQSNVVDTRSEWRTFNNDDAGNDDPSRVGEISNSLYDGDQLTTTITFDRGNQKTRELMRAQTKVTEEKGNKGLQEAYSTIDRLSDTISVGPAISKMAKELYKVTHDGNKFRGKSNDAVIAGCLFIALRQSKVPRSFKEIGTLTGVPKKEIGRIFKQLESFFKHNAQKASLKGSSTGGYAHVNTTPPRELCNRFGGVLGLPVGICNKAGQCADLLLSRAGLGGRSPLSVAALSLYIISHLMGVPKSAKDVGEACAVSDGTIRTAWKGIYASHKDNWGIFIKDEWLTQGGKLELLPVS